MQGFGRDAVMGGYKIVFLSVAGRRAITAQLRLPRVGAAPAA